MWFYAHVLNRNSACWGDGGARHKAVAIVNLRKLWPHPDMRAYRGLWATLLEAALAAGELVPFEATIESAPSPWASTWLAFPRWWCLLGIFVCQLLYHVERLFGYKACRACRIWLEGD